MLLATPPCQGLSTLGKNKNQAHYEKDKRNFLVLRAMEIIDACDFDYILIENVPTFLDMYFPFDGEYLKLEEILNKNIRLNILLIFAFLMQRLWSLSISPARYSKTI